MKILKKDAYVVAAAPIFALLGAYFYELGRYAFFDVSPILIDLPTIRVLVAGLFVAAFFAILSSFILSVIRRLRKRGVVSNFVSWFIATYLWLGLPLALVSKTPYAFFSTFVPPLVIAIFPAVEYWNNERKIKRGPLDSVEVEGEKEDESPSSKITLVSFLIFYGLALISSLGIARERFFANNACTDGKIVVAINGDNMILKNFDPATGALLEGAVVRKLEGAELRKCSPGIEGKAGFEGWMHDGMLVGKKAN
ncbi:hypothetical protein [Stenotrophomonas geniculata]|uniref:hypothetical protein n=1 Tax=Stenotrophomonas geniculata TaxID=86188 RepID=UPI002ACE0993|nr:hypothetical protein [Stenotrophomonas geniculata]